MNDSYLPDNIQQLFDIMDVNAPFVPLFVFGRDMGFTISILIIPVALALFVGLLIYAYKRKQKDSKMMILIVAAFSSLLLLLPFAYYQVLLNSTYTQFRTDTYLELPAEIFQTCISAPDSYGCELCKNITSEDGAQSICDSCEDEYRQLASGEISSFDDISDICN